MFRPWALALGTPVLVVAGIGHAVHGAMRKRVKGWSNSSSNNLPIGGGGSHQNEASLPPMSREYASPLIPSPYLPS